jgi:LEA14-like dessication related protein
MPRLPLNFQATTMRFYSLILLFPILLTGCAGLLPNQNMPKVDVAGIDSLPGQGMEFRMAVKLRVLNPSDNPIEFNGVFVEMDVQGKSFASGVSDISGSVPRYGETVITVPVSISALAVLRQAMSLTSKNRFGDLAYEIRGKIAGPAFNNYRFSSQGEFKLPAGLGGAVKE